MPKKILFITSTYPPEQIPGGSIFFVKDLAENFRQSGFEVEIAVPIGLLYLLKNIKNYKSIKVINGVRINRFISNYPASILIKIFNRYFSWLFTEKAKLWLELWSTGPIFIGLKRYLRRANVDVIHTSTFPLAYNRQVVNFLEQISYKGKFILTPFYHDRIYGFKNPFLGKILKRANIVHVVTEYEGKQIAIDFNLEIKKIKKISLFLKEKYKFYDYTYLKNNFRNLYKISSNNKIILFVGNKYAAKGLYQVVAAAERLYALDRSYRLIVAGGDNKMWLEYLKSRDLPFLINLKFIVGEEKEAIFDLCDVFCMPSIAESFGLVYLEALQSGKHIIAANIPSVREVLKSNAQFVEFGDVDALVWAIQIALDKNRFNDSTKDSYKKYVNLNYSYDVLQKKYQELFGLA